MSGKTKDLTTKEEQEVDTVLFNEACEKITNIFSKHAEEAVKEVGEYLINEFFEGDYGRARKKDKIKASSKGKTLNQVFKRFIRKSSDKENAEGKEDPKGPSKSWLYQAINLVIQKKDLKESLVEKSFQTYGKLLLSHKVELLRLKDDDIHTKEELILKVDKETLTVSDLREEINRTIDSGKRTPGIFTFIKKPELLLEATDEIAVDSLKDKQLKYLERIPEKINEKQAQLRKALSEFNKEIDAYNQYLEKFDELKNNVGEAIKIKEKEKKTKSKK